jgi:hypothetical protein
MNVPVIVVNKRIERIAIWDGARYINGRPHGSNWKPYWDVIIRFESEEDARRFLDKVEHGVIAL